MAQNQSPTEQRISFIERQIKLLGRFEVEAVIVGGVAATLHGSEKLILAKRAAARPKDLITVIELEAILAQQTHLDQS